MHRKESRQFFISVEGINCEKLYFEHLARIINSSDRSTYNLKVAPRKMSPMDYAKRNAYKPVDKRNNQDLPYIHVQDIEDYYDDGQRRKFFGLLDEIWNAEKTFDITYQLGYSNYTFELWMLLHATDMEHSVQDRYAYLKLINKHFNRHFNNLDEFKAEKAFQEILDEYVNLDSILHAIARAEKLVQQNREEGKPAEYYKGFSFYKDNPDISVHKVVKLIFEVCKVK